MGGAPADAALTGRGHTLPVHTWDRITQVLDVSGRRQPRRLALARLRDIALGRVAPATFFSLVLAYRAPHIWATLAATGEGERFLG